MGWGGDCNVWKIDGCNSKCFLNFYFDRMCVLKVPYAKMYFSGSPNLLLGSFKSEPQTCLPNNMPPHPKCHPNVLHGRPRFGPSFAVSLICVCVCACAFFFFLAHGLAEPVLLGNLSGMCHLCKGGSECARRPNQLQATAP